MIVTVLFNPGHSMILCDFVIINPLKSKYTVTYSEECLHPLDIDIKIPCREDTNKEKDDYKNQGEKSELPCSL